MCPVCLATAAWMAAAAVSTGGLSALANAKAVTSRASQSNAHRTPTEEDNDGKQHS